MVKTKQTKLVKGSASSKKLNLQLKRAQSRKKELEDREQAKKQTQSPKICRESIAHKSQKLNAWTPQEMEEAIKMYRDSRAPAYKGQPVSDPVCRLTDFFFRCVVFCHFSVLINQITIPFFLLLLQLSIRAVASRFPTIGYTILQGRLCGRVQGYSHASGSKGKGRILPPATEGE